MFLFGFACGAAVVGAAWWIRERKFKGVVSDLTDARNEIKSLRAKV